MRAFKGEHRRQQRVLNASKALINNERFSNLYFSPDLTNGQRKAAFLLREERRRRIAAGEDNLVIRRGKIVERVARQESSDHSGGFGAQLIGPIQLHVKRQNSSICKFFQDIAWTFFCL